jgi:3-hydroxybutyryl-CoA dehydrogenase
MTDMTIDGPTTDFPTIGLVGFGTMGAGIAQVLVASGRKAVVFGRDQQRLDAGTAACAPALDTATLARITTTTQIADLADVDAVIEAVTEDPTVKATVLADIAAVVGEHIPLLTNTSTLSVTELAAALPNPARVAGVHFFNPAPVQRTVEVVPGLQTDKNLVERMVALVATLPDKYAVVVKDRPGFLVNSLLLPYLNDVIAEFDDELATAEDIDIALELGLGYRTGPFKMLDMIGLDTHLTATESLYAATQDARYAPPPLLRQMVAAGRLGDKNGHGFRTGGSIEKRN